MTVELDSLGELVRSQYMSDSPPMSAIALRARRRCRKRRLLKSALSIVVLLGAGGAAVVGGVRIFDERATATRGGIVEATGKSGDRATTPSPSVAGLAAVDKCLPETLDVQAPEFVGLSEDEGAKLAAVKGYLFNVIYRDGNCLGPVLANLNHERLNVGVENGKIVRAARF